MFIEDLTIGNAGYDPLEKPMAIRIKIEATSTLRALSDLKQRTANLKKPLHESGAYLKRETQLNFARESDPDGKPWAPLKPSTLRRKRTRAILRESGSLAGSITFRTQSPRVRIVVGVAYGIYHQTGTVKMAQRKILGISEDRHVPKIRQIFERHFAK